MPVPLNQSGGGGTTLTGTGIARNTGACTELSGDVTTSGSNAATVVQVNGATVPASKTIVGTNGSGQIIDATASTLTNKIAISDTAANADLTETNITTATSGTTNASPTHQFIANYWTGAASASDTWTLGSSLAPGTNGASTLTFAHSGSTGTAIVLAPNLKASTGFIGAVGQMSSGFGLNFNPTGNPIGFYATSASTMFVEINGSAAFGWTSTAVQLGTGGLLTWGTIGGSADSGLSRLGASSVAIGNGTASDVSGALTLTTDTHQSANGAQWVQGQASELLTLSTSGLTTDTAANLLPANSIIEAVVCRITTTITTTTNWAVGDATISNRFSSANATLTSGTTSVGLNQVDLTGTSGPKQISAAKVRITCTGSNPGAGAIRITVFYRSFVAPTS